jgi:hypothetical protein
MIMSDQENPILDRESESGCPLCKQPFVPFLRHELGKALLAVRGPRRVGLVREYQRLHPICQKPSQNVPPPR